MESLNPVVTNSRLINLVGRNALHSYVFRYISAAIDWCMWVWNEKRSEEQRHLESHIREELFRLKLYRNRTEIEEFQQSTNRMASVTKTSMEYYSPDDIKQILERTAQFTRT